MDPAINPETSPNIVTIAFTKGPDIARICGTYPILNGSTRFVKMALEMASTPLRPRASRKRPRNAEPECFEDLSCVAESSDAVVQGVINVGPMATGNSGTPYFHGSIADRKRKLRVFGFDTNIRKQLAEASGRAVVLKHCEVKPQVPERGGGLQVRYVASLLTSLNINYKISNPTVDLYTTI